MNLIPRDEVFIVNCDKALCRVYMVKVWTADQAAARMVRPTLARQLLDQLNNQNQWAKANQTQSGHERVLFNWFRRTTQSLGAGRKKRAFITEFSVQLRKTSYRRLHAVLA
jgi:hypothetical protein